MYTSDALRLIGAALCGAALLSGCANHLPQRSEHEERVERKLLEHDMQIDIGEPKVLELAQRRIRFHEQKTYDVTTFEVTRRYDRYTPYQPWRELYEIPAGAVALTLGLASNVVNIAMLGTLPNSVTRGWVQYGVDGLNPFMNVESNGRAEQNLASIAEVQKSHNTEQITLPWAERPVLVKTPQQQYELLTDSSGVLNLNLLDNPFTEQDVATISSLELLIEDQQSDQPVQAQATLLVSPTLRGKLQEAHQLIFEDLETGDIEQWVARVKRLSNLGLEAEANELEQSLIELSRHDPELQASFLQALRNDGRLSAADDH